MKLYCLIMYGSSFHTHTHIYTTTTTSSTERCKKSKTSPCTQSSIFPRVLILLQDFRKQFETQHEELSFLLHKISHLEATK